MNINVPLPPHLDQFVRDQLATGRFQSEGDVIRAALRLLEDQLLSQKPLPAPLKTELQGDVAKSREARRSPRGLLADLRSYISLENIKDARSEMWSKLPHGDI